MRTVIHQRPGVAVTLVDSQHRPLTFSAKRLAMLQEMQKEFPELPLLCTVNGQLKHIELQTVELWDMKLLYILNTSVS
jgi:hypothetical protein